MKVKDPVCKWCSNQVYCLWCDKKDLKCHNPKKVKAST